MTLLTQVVINLFNYSLEWRINRFTQHFWRRPQTKIPITPHVATNTMKPKTAYHDSDDLSCEVGAEVVFLTGCWPSSWPSPRSPADKIIKTRIDSQKENILCMFIVARWKWLISLKNELLFFFNMNMYVFVPFSRCHLCFSLWRNHSHRDREKHAYKSCKSKHGLGMRAQKLAIKF